MKSFFKRFVALALVLCMVMGVAVTASADEETSSSATLALSAEKNETGDQVVVTVNLTNCANLTGLEVYLEYDNEKVSYKDTDLLGNEAYVDLDLAAAEDKGTRVKLTFGGASDEPKNGLNGVLGVVTFDINSDLPSAESKSVVAEFHLINGVSTNVEGEAGAVEYDPGTVTVELKTARNPFTDVQESDYFYEPVLWAYENGIVAGVSETEFRPNDNCTRAHVVTFLWRAAGEPEAETTECPFEDVEEGTYYYEAVLWAYENGIVAGIDATHFCPNNNVTRAQAVTFLWRFCGAESSGDEEPAEGEEPVNETPFTDVDPTEYYYEPVLWAYQNGIASGMTESTFEPMRSCTRGQVVTFMYRALAEQSTTEE